MAHREELQKCKNCYHNFFYTLNSQTADNQAVNFLKMTTISERLNPICEGRKKKKRNTVQPLNPRHIYFILLFPFAVPMCYQTNKLTFGSKVKRQEKLDGHFPPLVVSCRNFTSAESLSVMQGRGPRQRTFSAILVPAERPKRTTHCLYLPFGRFFPPYFCLYLYLLQDFLCI